MVTYTQYEPSKVLDKFIECFWIWQEPVVAMSPMERLIPGGRIEMIFNFGSPMQFLINDDLSGGQAMAHASVNKEQLEFSCD